MAKSKKKTVADFSADNVGEIIGDGLEGMTEAYEEVMYREWLPRMYAALLGAVKELPQEYREYVLGNIYGVPQSFWYNRPNSHQTFKVTSASDTVKKFDGYYEQMGARLYKVDLPFSRISENPDISFTLTGPYNEETEVSVFKFEVGGDMQLLDQSTTGVIVEDVNSLIET